MRTSRGETSRPSTYDGIGRCQAAGGERAQRQRVRGRQAEAPLDVADAAVRVGAGEGGRLGVDRVDALHVALGQVVGLCAAARLHQLLAPVDEHRSGPRELVDQRVGRVGGDVGLVRVVGPACDAGVEHLDRLDRVELGDGSRGQHVRDAGRRSHRDGRREPCARGSRRRARTARSRSSRGRRGRCSERRPRGRRCITGTLSRCEAALTTASAPASAALRPSAPSPRRPHLDVGVGGGEHGRAGLVAIDQDHLLDAVALRGVGSRDAAHASCSADHRNAHRASVATPGARGVTPRRQREALGGEARQHLPV